MRARRIHVLLILFMIVVTHRLSSNADEISEFRAKYDADFSMISNRLKHVKGVMKLTIERFDENRVLRQKHEDQGTFAISGNFGKCVLNVKRPSVLRSSDLTLVYCNAEDMTFKLSKNRGANRYALNNFESARMNGGSKGLSPLSLMDFRMNCGQFWTAPYLFYSNDWRSVLDPGRISPAKIKSVNQKGMSLIRVSYDFKGTENEGVEIDLDPSANHRILRSAIMSKKFGKPVFLYQVEYDDASVVPKAVTYDAGFERIRCEFYDLCFEPTPVKEFRPSFFGIPDIESETKRNTKPYLVTIIGFAIFLIIYGLTRRKAGRSEVVAKFFKAGK